MDSLHFIPNHFARKTYLGDCYRNKQNVNLLIISATLNALHMFLVIMKDIEFIG